MDEIEFLHHGMRMRLTRQQVIDAMRDQVPEPIREWAVEIEGVRFPVKQVRARATGEPRRDFNSHQARDVLRRLGFRDRVRADAPPPNLPPPTAAGADGMPEPRDRTRLREVALNAAVAVAQAQAAREAADVLALAEAFETWLTRP